MLDLNSPRWRQLAWHIQELPPPQVLLREWKAAIGSRREDRAYDRLFEQYLHQLTILSCAWAVVPHVVAQLPRVDARRRQRYLEDVAQVELCRCSRRVVAGEIRSIERDPELAPMMREHFVRVTRARLPPLPKWLAADYLAAIERAKKLAVALLPEQRKPAELSRLLGVLAALQLREETRFARALLQPAGLSITAEHENQASLASLFSKPL